MAQILVVNLTKRRIDKMETQDGEYGRGLAVKLLKEYAPDGCGRFDESNAFVIVPGLFTGARIPCATRATVAARDDKAPGIKVSSITGDLPQKLASVGVAALVVTGCCASGDCVVYIDDSTTSLHHMPELKNRECGDIVQQIRAKWGEECAIVGCGPAADRGYAISTLFTTYPEGNPRFSCPRSSFGDIPARKGLRAVVVKCKEYFGAVCKEATELQKAGKKLAGYIVNDPICGGALPGLGSITLLHLLKKKEKLPEIPTRKGKGEASLAKTKAIAKDGEKKQKTNYCCAPMCVIGCLNRHSGNDGRVYTAPEDVEVRAAIEHGFGEYFSETEMDCCAAALVREGMKLGVNLTELAFTFSAYFDGIKEKPTPEAWQKLLSELVLGTEVGELLGGGTRKVSQFFKDNEKLREKVTRPAVQKEAQYQVRLDKTIHKSDKEVSDMELLYREIFLFENLGICIFSSFALLDKKEPLELLAELYQYKTGESCDVQTLLDYSAKCLEREDQIRELIGDSESFRSIPEFVKVLYQYFENAEG